MDEALKKRVAEIADLAKTLPSNFQERAFEILLNHELSSGKTGLTESKAKQEHLHAPEKAAEVTSQGADDLKPTDLHVKAKKFLEKQGLSLDHLNELFYKEGGELKPLFEDLKTTRSSESQVRLGLLMALQKGINTGEFQFSGEDVREACQLRKCYDAGNFSANFKNNVKLFEGFSEYDKKHPLIKLSEKGRAELAKLIKELQ